MAALYADENFPQPAVEELIRLGHDVLTAGADGRSNRDIPDPDVLARAAALGRAVLTQDRDYLRLHKADPKHAPICWPKVATLSGSRRAASLTEDGAAATIRAVVAMSPGVGEPMPLRAFPLDPSECVYPESDGKPLAENTKQLRWIVVLYGNLAALFRDRPDVFVAGDLFWYPVQGQPEVRQAPDVLVVFGRPKGDRPSYLQWLEGGVAVTVVFEILSPGNTVMEMDDKLAFYEEHGVEEYYIYDPDSNRLSVYVRRGEALRRVRPVAGHVSARLGIRFDLSGPEMVVFGPDGQRFLTFEDLTVARLQAEQRANQAERRAKRLAELGRKARQGSATPAELEELERLETPSPE
jgi:Uma2 family endonuclease